MAPTEVAEIANGLRAALAHLGLGGEVRAAVIDDAAMDLAHRQYSRVAGTTDVLTFDLRDAADGPLDTDLLICLDEAERQARGDVAGGGDGAAGEAEGERGRRPEGGRAEAPCDQLSARGRELLLYCLHGVLHCVGEDDHEADAARQMHAREDRVLTAIGIGPVYGRMNGQAGGAGQTAAETVTVGTAEGSAGSGVGGVGTGDGTGVEITE